MFLLNQDGPIDAERERRKRLGVRLLRLYLRFTNKGPPLH
jgi:hypothetical protein